MKKAMPYVGITGPINEKEVKHMGRVLTDTDFFNKSHRGMVGYLASLKTLKGMSPEPNLRYPPIESLKDLTNKAEKGIFTMIHYNSREMDTLAKQIYEVFQGRGENKRNIYGSGDCRSLQINIPFPDLDQVGMIKDQFPEMEIVFQANEKVIESGDENYVANRIAEYGDSLDHVLLDPSGGKGKPFKIDKSLRLYDAINSKNPNLTLGFAGGFTGENVSDRLELLISTLGTNEFSIDAEGGLRDKVTQAYGGDIYNGFKARDYVKGANEVLSKLV